MKRVSMALLALTAVFAGCALFRANPLSQGKGAVVMLFDTRTTRDLKKLRKTLADNEARATIFLAGSVTRGTAPMVGDLEDDGHEVGLSGLKGVNARRYCAMYGQQKYFQDEIVVQVLGARQGGFEPNVFLLDNYALTNSATLTLPNFLVSKGFSKVVQKMPDYLPPHARRASELSGPVVRAYVLNSLNFDRALIADLARRNKILVVLPDEKVLQKLLDEAYEQGVPFATLSDLR